MIVAIERDITATKAHQDELGRAKRAAEKGERAKARFLASMSHEIRTPMNGIIGMTELLAEENLSHDGGLYLDTIKHSAEALLTIINDILDFSKLKAGKLSISPVTFQLTDCFEGVLQLLRPQADQKGLTLSFHPTHLATDVSGDDGRLRQILINVVGNAIKFTNSGSVAISATTRMTETGYRLHVDVQDTGVGIAPEQIETIFDQFAKPMPHHKAFRRHGPGPCDFATSGAYDGRGYLGALHTWKGHLLLHFRRSWPAQTRQ